ncbi:MAG: ATP-grasp domain-containing protein [Cytophagales bacterium]|nr:MAG: ATP-grasp domain-containing protein [Cytophagales bacterium]
MKFRTPLFIVKLLHFEYWSWWFFYLPLAPYFLWYALRERSLKFFSLVNPSMELGGLIGESKIDILDSISPQFKPKTIFFTQKQAVIDEVLPHLAKNKLDYPIVIKPNVGERGNSVEKITNTSELKKYLAQNQGDFIIQEYIDYKIELGVMYYRFPNDAGGRVTSITMKKFLTVVGNGKSSIVELLDQNTRARFQLERLKQKMPAKLLEIPAENEEILIEPIGNHCRGTEFINRNDLIKDDIHAVFDKISSTIDGFYYGRFDLKVQDFENLYTGNNIKVMELNGVASEPAHIYDANYRLINAYKDILYHWRLMIKIYRQNKAKKLV